MMSTTKSSSLSYEDLRADVHRSVERYESSKGTYSEKKSSQVANKAYNFCRSIVCAIPPVCWIMLTRALEAISGRFPRARGSGTSLGQPIWRSCPAHDWSALESKGHNCTLRSMTTKLKA